MLQLARACRAADEPELAVGQDDVIGVDLGAGREQFHGAQVPSGGRRWRARRSARRRGLSERGVQLADQFSDSPSATRSGWVAPQDLDHDRRCEDPRLRGAAVSGGGIVSGGELERSRGMSGRSEDVLDLSGFRQGVEERRAGRGEGRARSVARRGLSRVAGLLSRSLGRPGAVTQRLGPLGSLRERLRGVDRSSWPPVVRAFTFEDRQCGPRTGRRVPATSRSSHRLSSIVVASSGMASSLCRGRGFQRDRHPPGSRRRAYFPHRPICEAQRPDRLAGVLGGGGGVGAAGRGVPDQDAGLGLFQPPAVGLLAAMMMAAQRGQVAFAGAAAFVVGVGVVQVAAGGAAAAAGRGAGGVAGVDQVPELCGWAGSGPRRGRAGTARG